jgi:hypothetical protein
MIILCVGLTNKEFQNDTFYTIKVGESIINNGIDYLDHFSIHTLSYSYPHWLYDVFIYALYNLFGLTGIYISTIILYFVLVLSIYVVNYNLTKNEFVALLVGFLAIFMLRGSVTARAQLLSAILFLWEVYFIEKFIKTKYKGYGLGLIIISWFIVNIHIAVWPFYFVVYLPYLGENFLLWLSKTRFIKFLKKKRVRFRLNSFNDKIILERNNNFKYLLIIMGIALLMGFLTPLKDMPFTYFVRTMMGDSQSYILEHQPLVLISSIEVMVLLFGIIVILMFTKTKIRLYDLFMLTGLLLMTFMSVRHMLLLIVVGSIATSKIMADFFWLENDDSIIQIVNTILKTPVLITLVLLVGIYSLSFYKNNNKVGYINDELYPVDACDYIIDNLDVSSIRLYNDYNYGSYLIYRGIPVFIDSRADLYLPEFNRGVTIFDDSINIQYNYKEVFDKYDVSHILIYNDNILSTILELDNDYENIYEDDYFTLYKKVI